MTNEQQFEQKISPQQEWQGLREKVESSPEQTREIVGEHVQLKPEQIYSKENLISGEDLKSVEKAIIDPAQGEVQKAVDNLFKFAEQKGIVNAAKVSKNLDPAIDDAFHDRLVQEFSTQQIK